MFKPSTPSLPLRIMVTRLSQVALLATLAAGWQIAPVQAQVARVAALERVTERKVGADAAWRQAHNGDALNVNDRFRTGKRSKADLKFTDGSLLRLGQLSSVEISSAKGVTLRGGQLLYAALKPGRVLAGAATAEIKGSVAIVTMNPDGSAEFSLFSGAMDVVAPNGTVPLPPGHWVTAFPDGSLSEIRVAPPLEFAFGSFLPDLTEQPINSPFLGSDANVRLRAAPQRLGLDQYSPNAERGGAIPGKSTSSTPGSTAQFKAHALGASSGLRRTDTATINNGQLAAQPALGEEATAQPLNAQLTNDLNTTPANQHIGAVDQGMGHFVGEDAAFIGALTSGGTHAYGGRLHAFGTSGHLYFDLAATPLKQHISTPMGAMNWDTTAVPTAFVDYRDRWGDVQIGRQRFLEGPTQATLFGSLVRPGGRESMDAIRFRPNIGLGRKLELAYIYDAFVHNLPYLQPGAQHGFYGRAAIQKPIGNFGVNLIKYQNIPGSDTLGASFDLAVPVVRNQVEFYSELGRDPFRRSLTTAGLAFPGLHERTDIDLFLEYARLGNSSIADAEPRELSARAYRHIGRSTYLVADLSHFSTNRTFFTVAIAVGAQSYRGNADR